MTFFSSEKAVSEVIGQVLVLGLTVTGIAMISLVGLPTIYSMQDMATVGNAEQAFTVMDSRISAVALGNTPVQLIDINLGGGTLAIEANETDRESYIEVNIAGDILPVPMGKVKYQLGERIVAYEGGGIWSKYPSGGSVMLSPPEFHYNGVTLTLPVINITGSGSTGGSGSATLRLKKNGDPVIKYPDTDSNRTNPVNGSGNDTVYVNISSDFYDAWADYARSLGYTIVTEDADNNKVSIELTVVPTTLGLSTSITNPVVFRGLDASNPAPLENWSMRIRLSGNNLNWDLRTSIGDKKLIFYTKGTGLVINDKVELSVGYQDDDYSDSAETWMTEDDNDKLVVGEDGDGLYVDVNLLNATRNLTYQSETVGSNTACTPGKINPSEFNINGFSWGENLTEDTTEKSLYNLTQNYMYLMLQEGDISFSHCGSQTPSGDSTMVMNYATSGAITYLHISDNIAIVDIV